MQLKTLAAALSVAAAAFGAGAVEAAEVSFAGSTKGCFGPGCTPGSVATLSGLTYTSSTFDGTTASGFLAIGNLPGSPNTDNLGSMALSGAPATYTGQQFTLQVAFTAPPGIAGGNTNNYVASLAGVVQTNDVGGVLVNFDNTPISYSFASGGNTGSFTFMLNDVSVIPGGVVAVTATITAAQQTAVPEPASILLLGSGLTGLAAAARRRLKK